MKRLGIVFVAFVLLLGVPRSVLSLVPWGPMSEIERAARKEGKLVIYAAPGHTSRDARGAISQIFKRKYGVSIDWVPLGAQDIAPRVLTEQRTKKSVADIVMTGFPIFYSVVKPRGYLQPILSPSSMERGVWRLDPGILLPQSREWLFINMALRPSFLVNTNLVRAQDEPKNYQDLLAPKWKGKVALQRPWIGGTGSGWFQATFKTLGIPYMRAIAKQVVLVARVTDVAQSVVRGQHPIGLAASPTQTRLMIEQGAAVKFIQPKEGPPVATQGSYFLTTPPHPNAAKLFYQWFYTQEGQAVYSKNTRSISLREDVKQDHIPPSQRYAADRPFLISKWEKEELQLAGIRKLVGLTKEIFQQGK